ncbi:hypothetical protein MRB53_025500 [Persea americana]|uniref:Uncharacterized protein n=1 Tax=Persea americana TaxID=3435 RepID=A0ACC2LFF3_PERAE|nr:hypothetical protein MRB53_025500 [Persea americana]
MASPSSSITPRKLRSDLYGFSDQDESTTPSVLSVLSSLIERIIARNERIARKCGWVSPPKIGRVHVFDCLHTPKITIQSFLERIFRYAHVAPPVYVVAYIYIDRLCQIHSDFRISACNVHRLLITSIMVASKFVEDMNYQNSYFAKVGGLTTVEMNRLEVDFLFLMGFKLHVNVSVFESYCCHLEREVSVGGGYQIERTLRLMCGGEITSNDREKTYFNQLLRIVGCSSH